MAKVPYIIKDRKIKMAILGCGRISKNHFEAIQGHKDNLELVAVCESNPEGLERAMTATGVPGFNSVDELLANSDADIVTICTPSGLHARDAMTVARAGRHVVTEKPMATNWQDGIDMVKSCDNAGVRLFVVKQNRLNATVQLLQRAIEQQRFGKIYMGSVNVFWTRPQAYYDQAKWRGTWEFDGGVLMNQASHYVDLLDWLLGPVESIHAMSATLARKIEAEDSIVMNLRWRTGTLGSVRVTNLTYPKNFEGSITILGEKGTVRIGGVAVNEIQKWEFEEVLPEDKELTKANYETTSVYGFGHPLYYDNVIKVMRGEADPLTDGREGLKSLEVIIAAYRSARDGTVVHFPLDRN